MARESLLVALKGLVDGVEGNDGTLTYMAFASLDDGVGARIFGQWTTREAMERFARRDGVNGFWMESKGRVKAIE
jgi:quinol monooxygenase YgiN